MDKRICYVKSKLLDTDTQERTVVGYRSGDDIVIRQVYPICMDINTISYEKGKVKEYEAFFLGSCDYSNIFFDTKNYLGKFVKNLLGKDVRVESVSFIKEGPQLFNNEGCRFVTDGMSLVIKAGKRIITVTHIEDKLWCSVIDYNTGSPIGFISNNDVIVVNNGMIKDVVECEMGKRVSKLVFHEYVADLDAIQAYIEKMSIRMVYDVDFYYYSSGNHSICVEEGDIIKYRKGSYSVAHFCGNLVSIVKGLPIRD